MKLELEEQNWILIYLTKDLIQLLSLHYRVLQLFNLIYLD